MFSVMLMILTLNYIHFKLFFSHTSLLEVYGTLTGSMRNLKLFYFFKCLTHILVHNFIVFSSKDVYKVFVISRCFTWRI